MHDAASVATLSVDEFIHVSGFGRTTTWALVRKGDIPSIRLGRRVLIAKARAAEVLGISEAELDARLVQLAA